MCAGRMSSGASKAPADQSLLLLQCAERRCRECGPLPEEGGPPCGAGGECRPDEGGAAGEADSCHPVGVAVVGGDRGTWKTIRRILSGAEFQCRGCFASAAEALEAIPKLAVRIVLVGSPLPDLCAIKCVRALRARQPGLGIILAGDILLDLVMVCRAVAAGADDCCLKPLDAEQFFVSLRLLAARLTPEHPAAWLTAREEQVLSCLARGLAYKEIEGELGLSRASLKKVQHLAFVKLKARNRTEAVSRWLGLTGSKTATSST